ncbi:hypothetical protein NITLEN_10775 [Nitrospira lenta]|uniref:Uncharacterized protein n=1 Tax=Nitrospira lenta TaxID=1436998 RepID=A0A330L3C1_9BACT|nr:hypothetical protein NITLEN_10775 [Nitrospira lenta]
MKCLSGLKLLGERDGEGRQAEKGVQNVVSPNAALIVKIRLREISQERRVSMS